MNRYLYMGIAVGVSVSVGIVSVGYKIKSLGDTINSRLDAIQAQLNGISNQVNNIRSCECNAYPPLNPSAPRNGLRNDNSHQ